MMRNPRVLWKVYDHVAEISRGHLETLKKTSANEPMESNTAIFSPIALPYVMAVFYETLRLYPPVPFEIKQCVEATTLPDETFLPKDSIVVWSTWAMNRSKITWGDDADDFNPERWLVNGNLVTKTAFEFPVFNGGPRTCLGKKMAEIVAVQVIAAMVLEFDFEPVDDKERISQNSLTLPMKYGLPSHIRSRTKLA
jgi:cytochrome P450